MQSKGPLDHAIKDSYTDKKITFLNITTLITVIRTEHNKDVHNRDDLELIMSKCRSTCKCMMQ